MATDTIIEEREEVMISPCGGNPTLRIAHFLKPTSTSTKQHLPPLPISSSKTRKPHFNLILSKRPPKKKWRMWVSKLKPKFQHIWLKAGIYEPILASTYDIPHDKDLVLGLAEKWCADTNTFIFPWGEVTVTLEDMVVLGGLSVLGVPFFSPLLTNDMLDDFTSMSKVYKKIRMTKSAVSWINYYMGSGNVLEHQAFLALWLSRYVLIVSSAHIPMTLFPIAIHLARGTRIALAPAVLASIYRDMSLLKNSMTQSVQLGDEGSSSNGGLRFVCHAPLNLVQIWAWERFSRFSPLPKVLKSGEPRSARWHNVKNRAVGDVSLALDSAGGECFLWRPYAKIPTNSLYSKLYRENEQWVLVESDVSFEIESFVRCLRVSKLVGIDCIEQYLPHRVANQFGLDQDLPPCVTQTNETIETAWENYNRPIIKGMKLYIPPRFFHADISARYLKWWRNCVQIQKSSEDQQVAQTLYHVEEDDDLANAKLVEGTSASDKCEKGNVVDEPMEDGPVSRADPPLGNVIDVDEIESDEDEPTEVQQLELEARIRKLEKLVEDTIKHRRKCYPKEKARSR